MTEDEIDCFNDSLARCTGSGRFTDRFHERFIASSDEVREKFKNTDMRRQRRMVGASFYMVMLAVDGHPEGTLHLERMATVHGRGHTAFPRASTTFG